MPSRAEDLPVSPQLSSLRVTDEPRCCWTQSAWAAQSSTPSGSRTFPASAEGVPGFELGPRLHEQVANAGAVFEMEEVRRIEPRGNEWAFVTDSGEIVAGAAIVATGSRPSKLGVPREDEFEGKGLSHCASCDGPLYRGKAVAIVGGGDSALLEALELTQHDVQVVLIDADEALSGQETYGRRVRESTQIEVRQHTVVEEILGDGRVDGVRLRDLTTGESSTLPAAGSSSMSVASRTRRASTGLSPSTRAAAFRRTSG